MLYFIGKSTVAGEGEKFMGSDIGVIGLGVMGANIARNLARHGYQVSVFNRSENKTESFISNFGTDAIHPCYITSDFVESLNSPRIILLMVKSGSAVDEVIDSLMPFLCRGDVVVDGGNSEYTDTERRCAELDAKGIFYIGCGISGGEDGALNGPSMMPGGNDSGWKTIKPLFQAIAAKADLQPCCDWIGPGGAGHFVKTVHNGIEYGDMQLICEAFQLMRDGLNMDYAEIAEVFSEWNGTKLKSYLIEITSKILSFRDSDGICPLDYILDVAGQKGTGKWTAIASLEEGVPLTLITEAVYARSLSAQKSEREEASKIYGRGDPDCGFDRDEMLKQLGKALYVSKIISYAQGFSLMKAKSEEMGWSLNLGNVALLWREGCIIRSDFLCNIKEAYDRTPDLSNLLLDDYFSREILTGEGALRKVVSAAAELGIPMPSFFSALSYFDGFRCERLSANLLQAQRDFFGSHKYERTDMPRATYFHTKWQEE